MKPVSEQARQEAVLSFLATGANGAPTRIDTHASIVFLEHNRVLKIKRAVRLPFLVYSSLARRKLACDEELLVNKRNAPAIYRRVVPITRSARGFEIGGSGEVVEWAVEMARFDERQTFDHLGARGEITAGLGEALAEAMLTSHDGAPRSDGSRWLASIPGLIDRNTERFRTVASLRPDDVKRLHRASRAQMDEHLPLLQQRAAKGLVRHCHGDAHLGNIVLIDGKPVLFDAIEFDPVIATTDVLYDLAFPLMDLVHFEAAVPANRLFDRYLQASWHDNAEALNLLPLFLSIRAAIRAHVLFTKDEQSSDRAVAIQARRYFDLAMRLVSPRQPSLVAVGGRSGTGKSVLARSLAATLAPPPGGLLLRSDVIRKDLFGVDPLTALPATAYEPAVTARVYHTMAERAAIVLRQGISVVLDAAYLREDEREGLPALAAASGAAFHGLFLDADINERLKRIATRRLDASDANRDVAMMQESYDIGKLDWAKVDASGPPDQTLTRAAGYLNP
jgi:aminoglycoside phosphotransferase family enzyme/predicted kinase